MADQTVALSLLRTMLRIRRLEERVIHFGRDLKLIRGRHPELADLPIVFVNTPDFKGAFQDGWGKAVTRIIEELARRSLGDVLIGASALVSRLNGTEKASHIRDKLVEMTHLNETIYATGIAASYQSQATKSGAYLCDDMLANVCKHHVTRIPYEMGRLAQDLAGAPGDVAQRLGQLSLFRLTHRLFGRLGLLTRTAPAPRPLVIRPSASPRSAHS